MARCSYRAAPACADAERLLIAPVRHLCGQPSERAVLAAVRRPVVALRNRIATTIGEFMGMDRPRLARHDVKTVWGLSARTAATIRAHPLLRLELVK